VRGIDDSLRFEWEAFSAVKIDYFPHRPELFTVTNNHLHIIRLAMQRVMEAGYKRIALVMDRGWDETVDHHWCAGFIWEQQKLDPSDRIEPYLIPGLQWEEHVTEGNSVMKPDMLPHHEELKRWLMKEKPEVIISKDQFVLPVLEELGWRVPGDVALVDLFLENKDGQVAGVFQNHHTVGGLAVETVAAQIQHNQRGIPAVPTTSLVEGTWVAGASLPPRSSAKKAATRKKPRARKRSETARSSQVAS